MTIFHCIPESCAEIRYREYLPAAIRYRYPDEEWTEINGDEYTVSLQSGTCPFNYHISFDVQEIDEYGNLIQVRNIIYGIGYIDNPDNLNIYLSHPYENSPLRYFRVNLEWTDFEGNPKSKFFVPNATLWGFVPGSISEIEFLAYYDSRLWTEQELIDHFESFNDNYYENYCSGGCVFNVYKDDKIIHTETRSGCPEVEQLDCRLSPEEKVITVKKLPWFQRVEIRNQAIDIVYLPTAIVPLIVTTPIPEECLNIYATLTLSPPYPSENVPLPGLFLPYTFIAQISSTPGCPPPEYYVVCDCDKCPEGTCEVECDGHLCCYDSSGIAVKSIPI